MFTAFLSLSRRPPPPGLFLFPYFAFSYTFFTLASRSLLLPAQEFGSTVTRLTKNPLCYKSWYLTTHVGLSRIDWDLYYHNNPKQ